MMKQHTPLTNQIAHQETSLLEEVRRYLHLKTAPREIPDHLKECQDLAIELGMNLNASLLYSELGFLLSEHLELDPSWPSRERWIDNTGFLSESLLNENTIHLIGYVNWGYSKNSSNGIYDPFDAELCLIGEGTEQYVNYCLRFSCDGIARRITPLGLEWAWVDSETTIKPDVQQLVKILEGTNANEKRTLVTAPGSMGLRIETARKTQADAQTRTTAALCLGKSGRHGFETLLAQMDHPQADVRCAVLQALAEFSPDEAIPIKTLVNLMSDEDDLVRCLAVALYLDNLKTKALTPELRTSLPTLFEALSIQDDRFLGGWSLYEPIMQAILWLAEKEVEVRAQLIEALDHSLIQRDAINLLSELGPLADEAIPKLVSILNRDPCDSGLFTTSRLWKIGTSKARQAVWESVSSSNPLVAENAARTLQKVELDPSSAGLLIHAFYEWVRNKQNPCQLVIAIARIQPHTPEIRQFLQKILPGLIQCVQSQEFRIRWSAVEAIGEIGQEAVSAIPVLMDILSTRSTYDDAPKTRGWSDHGWLCKQAIKSLGRMGPSAERAIPLLQECCQDGFSISHQAVETLAQMGPSGIKALLDALKEQDEDGDTRLSYWIRKTLEKSTPSVIPLLIEAMNHKKLQSLAIELFCHFGPQAKEAVPILVYALKQVKTRGKIKISGCLGDIGFPAPAAISALTTLAQDVDIQVRTAAIEALGKLGQAGASALLEILEQLPETEFLTLCWVLEALGKIGFKPSQVEQVIQKYLTSQDSNVQFFAGKALQTVL